MFSPWLYNFGILFAFCSITDRFSGLLAVSLFTDSRGDSSIVWSFLKFFVNHLIGVLV